ncbi:hypothetical protein [Methanoregula sp.]|uniref:hypothetical protein n=1 Tax=Methanoregula sp. TaxID=2052170 RepID=UPI002C234376|nr:hypothetical protein [Methanoregula sp.]HVP96311.1 hypothetical protein [Methanoregula sp.]
MSLGGKHLFRCLRGAGPACLAVLCISAVLTAGCIGAGTADVATVAAPSVVSAPPARALSASLSLDPIVGAWRTPGPAYLLRITFYPDGTTQETFANQPGVMYNGTWQATGNNLYLVTRDTGLHTVWVYTASSGTIAKQSAPGLTYSLYQGTTDTSSASLSGNGSSVVPFTAAGSGTWAFTLNYTGERNYIVWLTDSMGSRVALLANSIGTSSVTITKTLGGGKYYLDVNASGPWTIQASLSA